jgi:hypothetical protein
MNVLSALSSFLILIALIICIIAWAGVAIKDPVLIALGLYFLALLADRLSGFVKPVTVVQS